MIFRFVLESVRQAFQQLTSNKLRTFLSLLGITIGIFCIISVKSAVNSLEKNVRDSFEKLGNDVLYISKMPWAENPHENYWKYFQRPNPDIDDLEILLKRSKSAKMAALSVFIGTRTLKYKSSSLENVFLLGVTKDYVEILKIGMEKGRWLTPFEYETGTNQVILGNVIAEELFGRLEPIGKEIKIRGAKFRVTGVVEKSGQDIINPVDFDNGVLLGYKAAKKIANVHTNQLFGTSLMVKAKEGADMGELKDEVTGILRGQHRLKPKEKDDFSINELSILSLILDSFFSVLNFAGLLIGFFAILVGMFSVANIMFVSVKERTNIIGIKMALGATRATILTEFLIEATIICLIGGIMGLGLVYLVMTLISALIDFDMFMSVSNISWGIGLSVAIGIISGLLPALMASRLDPVEAMRQ